MQRDCGTEGNGQPEDNKRVKWYAWQGSNLRPSVPETDALVQLSYRRMR